MDYYNTLINGNPLKQVFREIRVAYGDSPTKDLALEIANVLLKNEDFSGPEYRFMCWLKHMDIYSHEGLELPNILNKKDIAEMSIDDFEMEFANTEHRKILFHEFVATVIKLKAAKHIDQPMEVIIGGSYLDEGNDSPNDIDCIFLIPEKLWNQSSISFMEDFLKSSIDFPGKIDFKTLPDNFSLDYFKGYNDISLMANNTKNRDNGTRMVINDFHPRRVVNVRI